MIMKAFTTHQDQNLMIKMINIYIYIYIKQQYRHKTTKCV